MSAQTLIISEACAFQTLEHSEYNGLSIGHHGLIRPIEITLLRAEISYGLLGAENFTSLLYVLIVCRVHETSNFVVVPGRKSLVVYKHTVLSKIYYKHRIFRH